MKYFFLILLTLTYSYTREYPKSYSSCIGCHGLKGEKNAQAPESRPNKMSRTKIIEALKAYKSGERDIYGKANMMIPFAKKLSDKQIKEIAYYLKPQRKSKKRK